MVWLRVILFSGVHCASSEIRFDTFKINHQLCSFMIVKILSKKTKNLFSYISNQKYCYRNMFDRHSTFNEIPTPLNKSVIDMKILKFKKKKRKKERNLNRKKFVPLIRLTLNEGGSQKKSS